MTVRFLVDDGIDSLPRRLVLSVDDARFTVEWADGEYLPATVGLVYSGSVDSRVLLDVCGDMADVVLRQAAVDQFWRQGNDRRMLLIEERQTLPVAKRTGKRVVLKPLYGWSDDDVLQYLEHRGPLQVGDGEEVEGQEVLF